MPDNSIILKRVKFSIMFLMGFIMVLFPNLLISILIFILGLYLAVLGFNALVSAIILIKYRKGWVYDGIKALLLSVIGLGLLFNIGTVAIALSGIIFVIIGLLLLTIGIIAIVRTGENSAGVIFIVVGLLIALFPLGVSHFITRLIGLSLIALSISLLFTLRSRSS